MRFPCVSLEIRKRWKWRRNSEFPVETEIVHFTPSDPSASDRHSYLTMEGCDWLLEEKTFHTKEEALRFRSVLDGYRTFRLSSMSVMPTCSSTSWGRSGGSESSGCSVSDFHHLFILCIGRKHTTEIIIIRRKYIVTLKEDKFQTHPLYTKRRYNP